MRESICERCGTDLAKYLAVQVEVERLKQSLAAAESRNARASEVLRQVFHLPLGASKYDLAHIMKDALAVLEGTDGDAQE